ncbi:hypothetical protein B0O99DRAFT_691794 [Bisporella sp. PMI_857]|nr:hypothetical protein B0O99DRAFT_691794 [Bisporella sp. PMI_857]
MFAKLIIAITAAVGLAAAQIPGDGVALPQTLVLKIINEATGSQIGTLNGRGNFSTPGPSFPFRAYSAADGYSILQSGQWGTCTGNGLLACGDTSADGDDEFYAKGSLLVLKGTDGTWSVDALTDEAGGLDPYERPYGIPVHLGHGRAIPVQIAVAAAQG